jgi:hypothetical protein
MNKHVGVDAEKSKRLLSKSDPATPAIILMDNIVTVKAGTVFHGHKFLKDTPAPMPLDGFRVGDYGVFFEDSALRIEPITSSVVHELCLGGFHFAPGGNASIRKGGDSTPAINPRSLWDRLFRFSGADQRGMTLVDGRNERFWSDIYPLAKDHMVGGTSQFGVTIADGDNAPQNPEGGYFRKLDFAVAQAVMKHHGKTLHSVEQFAEAAIGVTELTAAASNPHLTGLDAPRTSQAGCMMMTGNKWWWCTDGDPEEPRASIAGGSWLRGGCAGSRCAYVGDWPGDSSGNLGARGRGDHLQLV